MPAADVASVAGRMIQEVEKAVVGKHEVIRQAVLTLLCNGHLLIEDIPGVGKTTLAKALAQTIGGQFQRLQFTPDLLPSDVTGAAIYNQREQTFEFRPGPVFGNVILVDEINRATPKTQSSLLEAMEERQVTTDGETRALPKPFFVMATQNQIEMTGTYPLPEAQLDRFFGRISIGYPGRDAEANILRDQQISHPLESVKTVTNLAEIIEAQATVRRIFISDAIRQYVVDLVRATREHSLLVMGASPRGSINVALAAQAEAALNGQDFVSADHVKAVAPLVLGHRINVRSEVRASGTTGEKIIGQVLGAVAVPPHTGR